MGAGDEQTADRKRTVWFGMKVTPAQKARIKRLAQARGTTAKQAVLDLVDQALEGVGGLPPKGSFLEGIEDLVGSVEGPPDLSTNADHMRGFGR